MKKQIKVKVVFERARLDSPRRAEKLVETSALCQGMTSVVPKMPRNVQGLQPLPNFFHRICLPFALFPQSLESRQASRARSPGALSLQGGVSQTIPPLLKPGQHGPRKATWLKPCPFKTSASHGSQLPCDCPNTLPLLHHIQPSPLQDHFAPPVSFSPRNFNIGSMLGCAPSQSEYIFARSSVLPRESTIRRKRSPLARVRPP